MAKVIISTADGLAHLRNHEDKVLCDPDRECSTPAVDGTLTCPTCAQIALAAVELVTKAEKREWRQL